MICKDNLLKAIKSVILVEIKHVKETILVKLIENMGKFQTEGKKYTKILLVCETFLLRRKREWI